MAAEKYLQAYQPFPLPNIYIVFIKLYLDIMNDIDKSKFWTASQLPRQRKYICKTSAKDLGNICFVIW